MPDKPNNPFQFWQELKRRKVIKVIAMYADTAKENLSIRGTNEVTAI